MENEWARTTGQGDALNRSYNHSCEATLAEARRARQEEGHEVGFGRFLAGSESGLVGRSGVRINRQSEEGRRRSRERGEWMDG